MRHEYIVQVDDTDRSLDFAFVGQIRRTCKQLVRCKDCKWFGKAGCAVNIVDESDEPKENDYCSWAERKEE